MPGPPHRGRRSRGTLRGKIQGVDCPGDTGAGIYSRKNKNRREAAEIGKERTTMKNGYWKKWCKAAGVRALKTVAQTAVATIGTSMLLSEVNWVTVASASVLAGALSLLTSVAGLPEVDE